MIPVSPNSFYAYLQAIVLGLKGLKIEAKTKEILQRLQQLSGNFGRFQEEYRKIGTHLRNATTSYEKAARQLDKFSNKLVVSEMQPDKDNFIEEKVDDQ